MPKSFWTVKLSKVRVIFVKAAEHSKSTSFFCSFTFRKLQSLDCNLFERFDRLLIRDYNLSTFNCYVTNLSTFYYQVPVICDHNFQYFTSHFRKK